MFTTYRLFNAVLKNTTTHRCRPIVCIEALTVSGPSLALVDESDITQFVEVVVEIVGFEVQGTLEISRAQLVVGDDCTEDAKPCWVTNRLLHRKIFFKRQPALFGEQWLWLANLVW